MQLQEVKRVGVIGGGQLAWMMAGAAKKLGIKLIVQTPNATDSAVTIAFDTILAPIADATATAELAKRCDVITFENEFIDLEALIPLARQDVCFRPNLETLVPLLDKYHQRCYLRDLGLPVPNFVAVEPETRRFEETGFLKNYPVVLKVRRHGYDGRGTFILKDRNLLEATLQQLGNTPVLLEEYIPFDRELAVIAARSIAGEIAIYPVVETQQENQVCRRVLVPAFLEANVTAEIERQVRTLLDSLKAVGIFGIELFLTAAGEVLVNEVSPRTHNSGHYTLDACETSQFEQHLRAVCHLPLGRVNCAKAAVMVNLLGYEYSQSDYSSKRQQLAQIPDARVHWYGKTESRLGRKLGHVTVLLDEPSGMQEIAARIESIWYGRDR